MNNKKPRLSAKQSQELTKLITITKTATLKAVMDPGELAKVIAVVASDLDQTAEMASAFPLFWDDCAPPAEYLRCKNIITYCNGFFPDLHRWKQGAGELLQNVHQKVS